VLAQSGLFLSEDAAIQKIFKGKAKGRRAGADPGRQPAPLDSRR
jgi:hypothetical protein